MQIFTWKIRLGYVNLKNAEKSKFGFIKYLMEFSLL